MNWTDQREIKKLLEWAERNAEEPLAVNNEKKESYWEIREKENTYIMPYRFQTIQEFEEMYDFVLEKGTDREVQRVISIAAFSCWDNYERNHAGKESAMDKIPEHIYVF